MINLRLIEWTLKLNRIYCNRYCGEPCQGCQKKRCAKVFRLMVNGERSTYCDQCEKPNCANCGADYNQERAFKVGSGRKWFCSNAACKTAGRKHAGRWDSYGEIKAIFGSPRLFFLNPPSNSVFFCHCFPCGVLHGARFYYTFSFQCFFLFHMKIIINSFGEKYKCNVTVVIWYPNASFYYTVLFKYSISLRWKNVVFYFRI